MVALASATIAAARGLSMRTEGGAFPFESKLVRMVLRVSLALEEDSSTISEYLFDETRIEYPNAAIIRGLITLGLAAIAGKASLADEFAGTRLPRGRKRGERWKPDDDAEE